MRRGLIGKFGQCAMVSGPLCAEMNGRPRRGWIKTIMLPLPIIMHLYSNYVGGGSSLLLSSSSISKGRGRPRMPRIKAENVTGDSNCGSGYLTRQ